MREIDVAAIRDAVVALCIRANNTLPDDVCAAILSARDEEPWAPARDTLDKLIENLDIAKQACLPICQDTGMACVFVQLGQDLHIGGGNLADAVDDGVRKGYTEGFLRASVVGDPLRRTNTKDNAPALLHVDVVPGDRLRIVVAPKGFGSENMSRLAMLKPSDGVEGVVRFVVDAVQTAGANPCPPVVLGVGIGGSFDRVALLAKKALLRPLNHPHPDPFYAALENRIRDEVNALGIGPQGFGGRTTAFSVKIEVFPTHIAGLPVAVNFCCHAARHAETTL